jgi:hypothetical protein
MGNNLAIMLMIVQKAYKNRFHEHKISQYFTLKYGLYNYTKTITVAAPSKVRTLFANSNAGIVGSNPTQGMDVFVRLFCLCSSVCK